MSYNSRYHFSSSLSPGPCGLCPLEPHQCLWNPALTMPQPCSNTQWLGIACRVRRRLPSWQPRLSSIGPHHLARFTPLPTFPPAYTICHVPAWPRLTRSLDKSFPSPSLSVWANSKKAKNCPVDSWAVNGKLRTETETTLFQNNRSICDSQNK